MRTYASVSIALALGLLCWTRPVHAEEENFTRSGVYLGISPLHVFEQFDLPDVSATVGGAPVTATLDSSDAWGVDSHIGYRFHPRGAAELQVQYFGDFGVDAHVRGAVTADGEVATINGFAVSANGKFYALTGRIQPYGVGGIGFLRLSADDSLGLGLSETDTAFAGRIGGGADLYLTNSIVLNGEVTYLLPTGDLSDFKMVPMSVGLQYRF